MSDPPLAPQQSGDGSRQLPPFRLFTDKLAASGGGQPVVFEFAIAIAGLFPSRRDPTPPLQSMQSRIEGTMLHLQQIIRGALDVAGDLVPVRGPQQERPQNDHVQRAL
jgi:hypothetical protein